MHHQPGKYLSGQDAMWANERRKLDRPFDPYDSQHNVRVVLTGSSRLLWAADLDILEKELGTRPIQLSLPGTSPALVVKDIVENTHFNGLIVVGVTPFLFNWLSEGFFGKDAFARYHEESPTQWVSTKLHDTLAYQLGFVDEAFSLFELIDHYSVLPIRENAKILNQQGWKLGDTFEDRQTDMWPPVEQENSFDNQQVTNFWLPGLDAKNLKTPKQMAQMSAEAIAFFAPLIKQFRNREGDMIFIRMPSKGLYLERDIKTNHKENLWQPMMAALDVPAINSMDYDELSTDLEIPEWSHFSRDSQDKWSKRIIPYMKSAYLKKRALKMDELIKSAKWQVKYSTQSMNN